MNTFNQISKSTYLELVRALAISKSELEDHLAELERLLGCEDETKRLSEIAEDFLVDVTKGYVGVSLIVPLKDVHFLLTSEFQIGNWHYDRKAECLLVNLRRDRHEHLSALLHQIYVNTDNNIESAAEKFIDEGLGWFKSSASFGRMLLGENVRLTSQEKAAFSAVSAY